MIDCRKFGLIASMAFVMSESSVYAAESNVFNISLKSSHYVNMERGISRIAVGNPEVATVVQLPSSNTEFLIITHGAGSTTLFVWTDDNQMHDYIINVSPEDTGKSRLIEEAIGLPNVHVKFINNRVLLTGTVENQYERNYAVQTARLFVGSGSTSLSVGSNVDMTLDISSASEHSSDEMEAGKTEEESNIIDLLKVRNPTQIRLEAQIIEINADNTKDLGIEYGATGSGGIFTIGENHDRTVNTETYRYIDSEGNPRAYTIDTGSDITDFSKKPLHWLQQRFGPINATIHTLVSNGKAKVLSRPNITTMSGEQATIQIGGQIPYTSSNVNGTTVHFKDYGIILQFKPIVDDQSRITSMVHTEVSNISGRSVDGQPIISTRRADSVITLRSGSTIVIGGLMDSSESKAISKIPLLGDIPILGELFKYNSKHRDKRELIILVTPRIVEDYELSRPKMSDPLRDVYDRGRREQEAMTEVDLNPPPVEEPPPIEDTSEQSTNEREFIFVPFEDKKAQNS